MYNPLPRRLDAHLLRLPVGEGLEVVGATDVASNRSLSVEHSPVPPEVTRLPGRRPSAARVVANVQVKDIPAMGEKGGGDDNC